MENGARSSRGWARIFGGLSPSPIEWLCLVAGLALVHRYFWILDDAFVYFRYVDNLLFLDAGLTYNRGEFVEGFSSPLWCLLLIALRGSGLDFWQISLGLALVSFVLFWGLALRVQRELTIPHGDTARPNLTLPFLTFNYGVACYFSSGVESPAVLVAAAALALYVLRPETQGLWLFVALTPLVRHELVLPLAIAVLWVTRVRGRIPFALIGVSLATGGTLELFRVYYYADLVPNTFHLKDLAWVEQGLSYLWNATWPYGLPIVLPVALVLLALLERGGAATRWPTRLVMLAMAGVVTAYVVRIGGDARHFRYLAFPFCLSVFAVSGVLEASVGRWLRPLGPAGWSLAGAMVAGLSLALYPPQLLNHPLRGDNDRRLIHGISDSMLHRQRTWPDYEAWGRRVSQEIRSGVGTSRPYRSATASYWCADHYRDYDVRVVHALGLTDPILARVEMPSNRPGHKRGLIPLANDLLALQEAAGGPQPGIYRAAVNARRAPAWIARNLEAIEAIEAKTHNRHDLLENIHLALTPPSRLSVEPGMPRRSSPRGPHQSR